MSAGNRAWEIPTIAEAGVPNFDVTFAQLLLAPRGTPEAIVLQLSQAVAAILKQPEVQERMAAAGLTPLGTTPAEAAAVLQKDGAMWERVVKRINLQLD